MADSAGAGSSAAHSKRSVALVAAAAVLVIGAVALSSAGSEMESPEAGGGTDSSPSEAPAAPALEVVAREEETKLAQLKMLKPAAEKQRATSEKVKVAVIEADEKVRTKLSAAGMGPPVRKPGDAPLAKAPEKQQARGYRYEEMFISHPDLFTIESKVKKETIQERVKSVYVAHAMPKKVDIEARKPPVLLLHGSRFSSAVWDKTGLVKELVLAGFHVYMVDLPGFGRSEGKVDAPFRELFLEGLIAKLKIRRPVIVSPSMSGSYSVPYVRKFPRKVSGFVPIAATTLRQVPAKEWSRIANFTRMLYVYGEQDTSIGAPAAEYFKKVPEIDVFMMKQGTHPCYMDKPKQFNQRLIKWLSRVNRKFQRTQGNKLKRIADTMTDILGKKRKPGKAQKKKV